MPRPQIVEVVSAVAADVVVKNRAGKVFGYTSTVNATLKDGNTVKWAAKTDVTFPPCGIEFETNITLNFSAAGTAYVIIE